MKRDGFPIRAMCADDVERVLQIATSLNNTPHWPRAAYLTAMDPQSVPRRLALVATLPGDASPVGYAVASLLGEQAELETIAVSAAVQRRGLGGRLLERILQDLSQEGVREVWLEVRPTNRAAIGLYLRSGFVESGRRRGYYADPAEDALVMTHHLK